MNQSLWAFIFQLAAPIGNALIQDLLGLFRKDVEGTPPTEADWTALGQKYGMKLPEDFLEDSLKRLAPPDAPV